MKGIVQAAGRWAKKAGAAVLAFAKKEPALVGTAINIGISTASTFGFDLSPDETFLVFLTASALLGVGIRQSVTPNVKVPDQS